MDDRLTAAEERIAHLLRSVEDLSELLRGQEAEVARLARLVDLLVQREAERVAAEGGGVVLRDERPPHW